VKFPAVVSAVALSALAIAVAAAAASPSLHGTFAIKFPKGHPASNAPCPDDAFCGVGSLTGYGKATITILDESFEQIEGSPCLAITRVEEIDLLDGRGTLVLDGTGTFCRPGGSGDSNAGSSSYGSPGRFALTATVDGAASTGAFAGMTGTVHETMNVAGAAGIWHIAPA
jgi:hypothetical protein